MKKIFLLLATPAILVLASCGGSKSDEASMENMKEIKFAMLGDSLSIMVPDSVQGNLKITDQQWGATEIKIGEKFQISVQQQDGDIALVKSDIERNDVFKLQKYITDEPNLLFWEAKNPEMEPANFHFYTIQKIGNTPYEIKDVDSGEAYSEGNVQAMIGAAKTLKKRGASAAEGEAHP